MTTQTQNQIQAQNQNMTFIKLKDLFLSEHNVRTVPATKEQDKLLRASIKAQGVTQNLIVVPEGKRYGVIAGGRRLAQLHILLEEGIVKADYLVPCLVEDENNISAISLAENIKATMHPADEFMAFQSMVDEGKSIAEIAGEFGITQTLVKKRLKLASVAPEIIQHYRNGKIDLEAVMAFTVCDDHDKQLACYKELSCHYLSAWKIKRYLLDDKVSTSDALVKLVTLKAFKKAGGTLTSDLFESASYINERELLESLALDKLQKEAGEIKGWKWVDVTLNRSAGEFAGPLQPEYQDVPESLNQSLEEKQAALDTLYNKDNEWSEEDEALEAELSAALEALESKRETYRAFTDEQKSVSGAVLSVNREGEITVDYGLVRKEDKKLAFPAKENGADGVNGQDAADSIESNALKSDLHNFKQQALQNKLMKNDTLAYDLMVYSLAAQVFSEYGYAGAPVDMDICPTSMSGTKGIDETSSHQAIEDFKASLDLSWLSHESKTEKFNAFRQLTARQKKRVVSYCISQSYRLDHSSDINQTIMTELEFDMAEHWAPTKDNYFSRVKKDALIAIAKKHISEEWVSRRAHLAKGKFINQMEAGDTMAGWMPQSMIS